MFRWVGGSVGEFRSKLAARLGLGGPEEIQEIAHSIGGFVADVETDRDLAELRTGDIVRVVAEEL